MEILEILNIPIYYTIGKKKPKNISLNMNWYRNAHYQVSNNVKRMVFRRIVDTLNIKSDPCFPYIHSELHFSYTIYRKTKRRADLGNLGSVIDKFVSDALVEKGVIEDDNTDIIKKISFIDGGVDKDNPRADLVIREFNGI